MARQHYVSLTEAAQLLGIHRNTIPALLGRGLLHGEMLAGRWLIERAEVEELAKTYKPQVGRPRRRQRRQTQGAGGSE